MHYYCLPIGKFVKNFQFSLVTSPVYASLDHQVTHREEKVWKGRR